MSRSAVRTRAVALLIIETDMKKNIKLKIIIILLLMPIIIKADGWGSTGFDFLCIDIGARPASMAGAFCATRGDINGLVYNVAGIVGIKNRFATFTFLDYLVDVKSGLVGFTQSMGDRGVFALAAIYTNYGKFQKTDIYGNDLGSFFPGNIAISAGYADTTSIGLSYGIAIKYLQFSIDKYTSMAAALSAGVIYRIKSQDLNIGFSINNLGHTIKPFINRYEKLPISYRLGLSKRLAHLPLLVNLDVIKYHFTSSRILLGLYWSLGGEFTITKNIFLRLGYTSQGSEEREENSNFSLAGFRLGLGIKYKKYTIDYGFGSLGMLGNMNHFTLSVEF